ncbi:hypothetical protein HPB51_020050 [Rhipicephalus microplus]|uniref:AMP-dependent synthetase/ligase domain-containing protein n=1 Tax=Rhipicephalus microplus TaxID=6941 RepID=A0A9J6DX70_RHIMP|nr:hypothetical protein HPB51_020050 [Rhipicephalus microplus]
MATLDYLRPFDQKTRDKACAKEPAFLIARRERTRSTASAILSVSQWSYGYYRSSAIFFYRDPRTMGVLVKYLCSVKGLFCMGHATGFVSAAEFLNLDENEYEELAMADPKSTVLAVCYTSGTTGIPKGTEVTHYSFVACFYSTK